MRRRTCALLTPVVQVLSVRQGLTGQVWTGQSVPVQQGTEGTPWCLAHEGSVSMTVNARWTVLVLTTTVGLLARMLVDRTLSARQGTTVPSVPVLLVLWGTLSQRAGSQDEHRLMSSDSLDSDATLILIFYYSLRTESGDQFSMIDCDLLTVCLSSISNLQLIQPVM